MQHNFKDSRSETKLVKLIKIIQSFFFEQKLIKLLNLQQLSRLIEKVSFIIQHFKPPSFENEVWKNEQSKDNKFQVSHKYRQTVFAFLNIPPSTLSLKNFFMSSRKRTLYAVRLRTYNYEFHSYIQHFFCD